MAIHQNPQAAHSTYFNAGLDETEPLGENLKVEGIIKAFKNNTELKKAIHEYETWGETGVYSLEDFSYTVKVPDHGLYDVTLIWAEPVAHVTGKRLFDVKVSGLSSKMLKNVDVFDIVGADGVHKVIFEDIEADAEIEIKLMKGEVGDPFLSGFIVGAPHTLMPKLETKAYTAYVNVTGINEDSLPDNITVEGEIIPFSTSGEIKAANTTLQKWAHTGVYNYTDFTYIVKVPRHALYDVELFWADPVRTEAGQRLFDVSISGIKTQVIREIDVAKEAGPRAVKTLKIGMVEAKSEIKIKLMKGLKENPFLNGFTVGAPGPIWSRPSARNYIAFFDVGGYGDDTTDDTIKLEGGVKRYTNFYETYWTNQIFLRWAQTGVYNTSGFTYKVALPYPGTYNVTLVWAEPVFNRASQRLFDFSIVGKESKQVKDVDLAKDCGIGGVHSLTVDNIMAESEIKIEMITGKSNNPFLCGLVVADSKIRCSSPSDFTAYFNVGGSDKFSNADNVTLEGDVINYACRVPTWWPNESFLRWGKTGVYNSTGFTYTVRVPKHAAYDVTLMWSEPRFKEIGQRLLSFCISGNNIVKYNDVDVVKKSGRGGIYKIKVHDIEAENEIKIMMHKGSVNNAFLCGFIVHSPETIEIPLPTKPHFLSIDLGGPDHSWHPNVSFEGDRQSSQFSTAVSGSVDPDFLRWANTHVWTLSSLKYTIRVPSSGKYDVTLVWAEVFAPLFEEGKRIFDISVSGINTKEFKAIDVFKAVGHHAVHTITIEDLEVDSEIHITISKGEIEHAFLCGFRIMG